MSLNFLVMLQRFWLATVMPLRFFRDLLQYSMFPTSAVGGKFGLIQLYYNTVVFIQLRLVVKTISTVKTEFVINGEV